MTPGVDAARIPAGLRALVVKHGVSIALLDAAGREQVLALATSALPPDRELRERQVNDALATWLDVEGAMLRTDHVELRRWLVDTGFLARDGFGRAYAVAAGALARIDACLGPGSPAARSAEVAAVRADDAERRAARRRAHDRTRRLPTAASAVRRSERGSATPTVGSS